MPRYNGHMSRPRRPAHTHFLTYPITMRERIWTILVGPLIILLLVFGLLRLFPFLAAHEPGEAVSYDTIIVATFATMARLAVAYVLAVAAAVPLALAVTSSRTVEAVLLPLFDVLESVPILALFPVIIMVFVQFNSLNGAAICIIFLTMVWNIVFTVVGGLKVIPQDILYAAEVFGVRGLSRLRRVILPSVVPQLVTGSILAVAQGWNIIIVAEVLHTYIPGGTSAQDLFGIGSMLVAASASGQSEVFLAAVVAMVIVIALLNFFVWQRLLHFSQRFRFE